MGHSRVKLKKKSRFKYNFTGMFVFSLLLLIGVTVVSAFFTLYTNDPVNYYDRETGAMKEEIVPGKYWIRWLYNAPLGKLTLEGMVSRKFVSDCYGKMMDKPSSAKKIPGFIKQLEIDMTPFPQPIEGFTTFNEFFTRRIDLAFRPIASSSCAIVSPADSKVLGFSDISLDRKYPIKGFDYNLQELLGNPALAEKYRQGSMLIFRLSPADYHRFHFPVDGVPSEATKIAGKYYSVSPLALLKKAKAFSENKREYCTIRNNTLGDVLMMEVGSTLTGGIKQEYLPGNPVAKGEEKGYFFFGGSTVILLFEPGKITIDSDISEKSKIRIETSVHMGERVARIK